MTYQHLQIERRGSTTWVWMNRPEMHNAFDDTMVAELEAAFRTLSEDANTRAIVLGGRGRSFCAGADLNWMQRMIRYSREDNVRDSEALAAMFDTLDRTPKPVIGRVHGAALGGGAGLVAICDIAVGVPELRIGFTEVKLGILPAVISPYVLRKIGPGVGREYFLTGERFDGANAGRIGLLNHVVPQAELDSVIDKKLEHLRSSGPDAIRRVKRLIRQVANRRVNKVSGETVDAIAAARVSDEGQEGMTAFLEKRPPNFMADS